MTKQRLNITRRQLLFGTGALSLLGTAFALYRQTGEYPEDPIELLSLSHKEAAIYRYIGKWMIPPGGPLPGHGGDDETLRRIDQVVLNLPEGKRWLLGALPLVFEHGTAFNRFGSKRLTMLATEDGHPYLEEWANSEWEINMQLFAALKTMYGFSYFERDDVLKTIISEHHCAV